MVGFQKPNKSNNCLAIEFFVYFDIIICHRKRVFLFLNKRELLKASYSKLLLQQNNYLQCVDKNNWSFKFVILITVKYLKKCETNSLILLIAQ